MMSLSRRGFVAGSILATGAATLQRQAAAQEQPATEETPTQTDRRPLFIATWPFGQAANERALQVSRGGGSNLDAVEQGIRVTEADASNASVGLGGTPNAAGVVQLDACIMDGPGQRGGSVAALEGILHPISVARRVMDATPHVMLAGDGARQFALEQGFTSVDLLTEAARERWLEWRKEDRQPGLIQPPGGPDDHDTITLLTLGSDGNLAGGCSTSGLAYKLPGRVGDSPILGSGLYVDNEVGAAGATGIGENVMRYCASFLIVEMMRGGLHPREACVETIRRIARVDPRGLDLSINFVALDRHGRYGAAGTDERFACAVTMPGYSEVLPVAPVQ